MTAARVVPVYFVLPPQALLVDIAGPAEALRMATRLQSTLHFDLHFVSAAPRVMTSVGLPLAEMEPLPVPLPPEAIVFVSGAASTAAGMRPPTQDDGQTRASIVNWLRCHAHRCHRLMFICSGAFLAAEAGLLQGRACTTHHALCGQLQSMDRSARVLENRIYVIDGPISTSAGVTTGLDLTLALLHELVGPACAVAVARSMVMYPRRAGQDPQLSPWLEGRNHMHPGLHRAQDAIAADPARAWTVPELAALANTSERHLARLFRAHANTNIVDYVHRLRVALAQQLIEQSELDLEQVAERSGFGSGRQLRRVWNKFYDAPPSHLRTPGAANASAAHRDSDPA